MTHKISAISKKSSKGGPTVIAIPVAKRVQQVPTASKLTASKAFIVDPEAEFKEQRNAEREANIAREGGSVHEKSSSSSADVKPPRHDPFAPKFAAGTSQHRDDHDAVSKGAHNQKLTQKQHSDQEKSVLGERKKNEQEHEAGAAEHAEMKEKSTSAQAATKSKLHESPKQASQTLAARQQMEMVVRSSLALLLFLFSCFDVPLSAAPCTQAKRSWPPTSASILSILRSKLRTCAH